MFDLHEALRKHLNTPSLEYLFKPDKRGNALLAVLDYLKELETDAFGDPQQLWSDMVLSDVQEIIAVKLGVDAESTCCDNEQRRFDGGCKTCGDPSL